MSSKLAEFASLGPHLEFVAAVPIEGTGQFVMHREHAFVSARYGSSHAVSVIDLREPEAPRLAETMRFKHNIGAVAMHGEVLVATETGRALNLINVANPGQPDYYDCAVALGRNLYDVSVVGDYAVVAMNWDGVGLIDLRTLEFVSAVKLDEGFVERLVIAENHIFAAGTSGGLRVFEIVDGALQELARPTAEGFNAGKVYLVGGEVWVVGGDDATELLVIDPSEPTVIASRMTVEYSQPTALLPADGGGALGFYGHYTCLGYDPGAAWSGEIFKQFTYDDDDTYCEIPCDDSRQTDEEPHSMRQTTCMDGIDDFRVVGDYLFASQGAEFRVYQLTEDSVFRHLARCGITHVPPDERAIDDCVVDPPP